MTQVITTIVYSSPTGYGHPQLGILSCDSTDGLRVWHGADTTQMMPASRIDAMVWPL
jgi:hypothetical protein